MTYAQRPRGRSQHRLSEETSYSIICRVNYLSTDKPSHGALSCFNFLASTNLAAGGDSNLSIFSFSFSFLAHFVFKFFSPTCERRVNLLVYSLSLHRHSYIGFILAFASSIHNKQNMYQWTISLPTRDFRSTAQKQGWSDSRDSFTYYT
jgi:hypothetical protein